MFDFEIAQYFYNMSKLLSVFEDNKYRTKAYFRAAMAIDSYSTYITELYLQGNLQSIEAIGQGIEKQIGEIIKTGRLFQLEQLEKQYHVETYDLLLYHEFSDSLKKKLFTHEIFSLGELSVQYNQSHPISWLTKGENDKVSEFSAGYDKKTDRYLYSQAYCLGMEIIEYLKTRLKCSDDTSPLSFSDSMCITNEKISVIEIVLNHEISLTKVAAVLRKNQRLKNIVNTNSCVKGITLFGIPFKIVPEEVSFKERCFTVHNGDLDILGDLHSHSTNSDGISDICTLAQGAERLGLDYFAVTDHSKTLKISHGLTETEVVQQIAFIKEINQRSPVKILSGIEVEILEDGTLDYSDDVLAQFDFVIAGMHTHLKQPALLTKFRLEKALSNPYVDILAHPTTRLLGRPGNCFSMREGLPVSVEEIIELCCKNHVAIEINCFPERFDFGVADIKLAAKQGVMFSIGTDSHSVSHLNTIHYGKMLAEAAGLKNEQVLNSRSYDELKAYFKCKRKTLPDRTYTPKDFSYYFAGNSRLMSGKFKVVGIDLTGSEDKPSGWAVLTGKEAVTRQIKSDDAILKATLEVSPDIVSIDSPLSLPKGRCCTREDCSCSRYGITRHCERMLMKFGIGVYPCLIPSMVKLTERGIKLASLFRENGLRVIESYPGVAQDVLNISRKRRGLDHLVNGLGSFGICGEFLDNPVSHDELDAITSAMVGYFYANEQYVGMGIPEENYLIVPRPQSDYLKRRVIIGLCGEIAAGKTTMAEYLKFKYGFETKRYSDAICKIYGIPYNRGVLQRLGAEIAGDENKQRELSRYIISDMADTKSYVIDGMRHQEDYEELSRAFGSDFVFIIINAEFRQRYKRYSEQMPLTIKEFKQIDGHGSESDIKRISVFAHRQINNNKSYKDFFKQVNNIIIEHSKDSCEVGV